jgi:Tfp pilus assembly protein PilE
MVVILVMAVVIAIALPSLEAARKSGFEAQAIARLKMTGTINEQYRIRFGGYASSEVDMAVAGMLHHTPGQAGDGFIVIYTGELRRWTMTATPETPGVTGDRSFFVDETGLIRFEFGAIANDTSAPLD